MLTAHRDLDGLTLDRAMRSLLADFSHRLADSLYNGMWFSPECEVITTAVRQIQQNVTGTVRLELYKGHATVIGRESPLALYNQAMSSVRLSSD